MEPTHIHPVIEQEQPTLPEKYVLPEEDLVSEPVASKPSWYRRRWVKRTAVATVIVVLAGATVGLVQRTNEQADQIDSKTAQVTHLRSKLSDSQDETAAAEDRASSAESEVASRKASATRVSGQVATCVSQMYSFLTALSSDLGSLSVLRVGNAVNSLPFTPSQAGTDCATARDSAAVAAAG